MLALSLYRTLNLMDIGVDTGGTFTDLICRRAGHPDLVLKVPSTPSEPSKAVMN